ncbi:recombination regulator RecX [Clostridium sp. KNHs214]|uniref:recombination regulator RecX n=1 Tax=Clostridium sp. KNHs214 TaxID=1540257 RepID=UPI0005585787|nr:recombination regulator RecX [Clostridium sp. KNHs214]
MSSVISSIEVQKRDKNRVNVYIDNEFAFGCNAELVYIYDLKKGKKVDLEFLQSVAEEDNYLNGKNYALKVIEKTYKTEKEIRDKLYKKEYGYKAVDRIIAFLKKYKFLDDYKYTETFIKDRIIKYGKNKIKFDLIKKGIEEDLIIEKLNVIDYEKEYGSAYALGEGKYKLLIKSEKEVSKDIFKIYKKVCDFLIRRGFDYNIVNSVIEQLKDSQKLNGDEKVLKYNENIIEDNEKEDFHKKQDLYLENKEDNEKDNYEKIKNLALKRYKIICKSESDDVKIFRRLSSYLMRRGYSYEEIKRVLRDIVE